jgi:transcriptional regulator with XRE-family HTH domain
MTAQELLSARTALGLTQAQLGAALGLSRAMIVAMEKGRRPVQRVTSLAILHLLWDGSCYCDGCRLVDEIEAALAKSHESACATNPPQNHK